MHESVLLQEVLSLLALKPGSLVVDGTLGSGGHAKAILEAIGPKGRLIGIDQDRQALERSKKRLELFKNQLISYHANFRDIDQVFAHLKVSEADAVLLDIGVSLEQLSEGKRGFSFRTEGPLDMRMDESQDISAAELVQKLSEKELSDIFVSYGEERHAKRIARWIVDAREEMQLQTTKQLADLIEKKLPAKLKEPRIHPATRVFQALRIAVNDELRALGEALPKAFQVLKPGGRLAVITFHSLEDRIVKQTFTGWKTEGKARVLTKKPVIPSAKELNYNPKSRSAKLRAIEKL